MLGNEYGRETWAFTFTAAELLAACEVKCALHRERVTFWMAEVERTEAELREHGVEFREQPVTGGYNLNVVLDPQRTKEHQDAKGKLEYHKNEQEQAQRWRGLLRRSEGRLFEVTYRDAIYFGLTE